MRVSRHPSRTSRGSRVIWPSFDPLYAFLVVGMASPGPNVILLTTYGARLGFRASVPPMLGIVVGVGIIGAASGLGMGALLNSRPELTFVAKVAAAIWILWIAWSLFKSERGSEPSRFRTLSFAEAVLFQWVNPKLWAVALAATAGFSKGLPPVEEAMRLGFGFSGVNLLVCISWTATGAFLGQFLRSDASWRRFATFMALALAASAAMVFV